MPPPLTRSTPIGWGAACRYRGRRGARTRRGSWNPPLCPLAPSRHSHRTSLCLQAALDRSSIWTPYTSATKPASTITFQCHVSGYLALAFVTFSVILSRSSHPPREVKAPKTCLSVCRLGAYRPAALPSGPALCNMACTAFCKACTCAAAPDLTILTAQHGAGSLYRGPL